MIDALAGSGKYSVKMNYAFVFCEYIFISQVHIDFYYKCRTFADLIKIGY